LSFCDHASGYIYVHLHVQQNLSETLEAKLKFEREMFNCGVTVKKYHTDNGIFSAKDYVANIANNFQSIRFSGPGAHHQNGVAERNIGNIFAIARTMLIHAVIRWPEVIEPILWPMAVQYSCWLYNHVPKLNSLSPIEILHGSKRPTGVL
jgi:hypothetical protein